MANCLAVIGQKKGQVHAHFTSISKQNGFMCFFKPLV
jgi:hypothetical protein